MSRTFSNWVGGVLRLIAHCEQRLADMPAEDVRKEGGREGETPLEFLTRHKQYFPTRAVATEYRRKEVDLDATVHVLDFVLVSSVKEIGTLDAWCRAGASIGDGSGRSGQEEAERKGSEPLRGLIVVAHPDDETIFAGGILASSQMCGAVAWQILCLTHDGGDRQAELIRSAACAGVGAGDVKCLSMHDTQEPDPAYTNSVRPGLVKEVKKLSAKSDILLTHGEHGEYGHPQHKLAYEVCLEAASTLQEEQQRSPALIHFGWPVRRSAS